MQTLTISLILILTVFINGQVRLFFNMDLILIFVIAFSVRKNNLEAVSYSFGIGFLEDILFSVGFVNTFIQTFVSAVVSFVKELFFIDRKWLCFALAFILTPASIFVSTLFYNVFYSANAPLFSFNIIVSSFLNAFLCPLFYLIFDWLLINEQE